MRSARLSVLAALLAPAVLLAAAAPPPDLHRQMGEAAFARAGLDKLSPAELASLQAWLATHAPGLAPTVPASVQPSAARAAGERPASGPGPVDRTVHSHIAGDFHGWEPGNVLRLANGQQWRVTDGSELVVGHAVPAPAVTIKPALLGGWQLRVEGYNTRARVEPAN